MPSRTRIFALFIAIVLPTLAGCTSWRAETPDVILTNLELLDSTVFEQRLRAHLRIVNPNEFDLEVKGLNVTVEVNETRLARGVSAEAVDVLSLSDATMTIDVSTTVFDLVRQAANLGEQSSLDYRVHGAIHLVGMLGGTLHFDNGGSLGSWEFSGVGKRAVGPLP